VMNKKLVIGSLVTTLIFTCISPTFAASSQRVAPSSSAVYVVQEISIKDLNNVNKQTSTPVKNGEVKAEGIRGQLVQQATRLLAITIRKGGEEVSWILKYVDADTAKAFYKYSERIASQLDVIAGIPDLTVSIVKEKIFYFCLNTLKLDGGISLQIADGIARALNLLLF